ncbi:hypothetical protein ABW21_db0205923 [Orbilia brochopaga]|nr:hypothetical protein ABW21_db0205923 [Drechslerella brochopaga]
MNDRLTKVTVSVADINELGSGDDEDSIPVFLEDCIFGSDIGLFLPEDPSQVPTSFLGVDLFIEAQELEVIATQLLGTSVFAVGYNGPPDQELGEWIRQYEQRISAASDSRHIHIREQKMAHWLHPYRKTLTHGAIMQFDFACREVRISCSLYKGYSGALVGIENPKAPGQLSIIAIVYGRDTDSLYNKGILLPSGFREKLRTMSTRIGECQRSRADNLAISRAERSYY